MLGAFKGSPGMFQHEFYFFYTDEDERQKQVLARFKGQIINTALNDGEKSP